MLEKLKQGHWPIFILSSVSAIANMFLPIILTRILTPEDIGIYKIFFLYLGLLPFLFLTGGPLHSVYYWVGKGRDQDKYITAAFQLTCILSLAIIVIGLPLIEPVASFFELSITTTQILLLSAFLWVPSGFYKEFILAKGFVAWGSIFGVLMELIKVFLFLALAFSGYKLNVIFTAFLIFLAFKMLLTGALLLKEKLPLFKIKKKYLSSVWNYCLPIAGAGLLGFVVDKIDQIVLTKYLAKDEFAFYTMGCLMIPPLYMLEMSIIKVLIPKLSTYSEKEPLVALQYFRKAISDSALLMIPAAVGLFTFSDSIVELLYTESYLESSIYLKIFSLSYLALILPYDSIPRATGQTKWIFKISLILSPLTLITVLIAANWAGAVMVLSASVFFKFIYRLAGIIYSCSLMGWRIRDIFPFKKLIIFTMISLLLGLSSWYSRELFDNNLIWFFTSGSIFFTLYFIALIIPYKKGYFVES